jgi:predicted metal-binding membrane protein
MPRPRPQLSRIRRAVGDEVHELGAVGAGFLALWLAIALIAAFVVLVYVTLS